MSMPASSAAKVEPFEVPAWAIVSATWFAANSVVVPEVEARA
ncbi:hypothetical protein [Arthrobacter crystallopoietes]|nr:hypothetical protein [Arthrobacter crystallopoietes]